MIASCSIASFREFRVITTLAIILGLVICLYTARWLYQEIKKWKESMKPQPIQTISKTISDTGNSDVPATQQSAHPQQPPAPTIQLNNQAFNPQIVDDWVFLFLSCAVFLIIFVMIVQIQPQISNERLRKFRPLIGLTCCGTLILCIFYGKNPSMRNFVWEMYFQ